MALLPLHRYNHMLFPPPPPFFSTNDPFGGGGNGHLKYFKKLSDFKMKASMGGTVSLVICGLHIYKVVYSLKSICNAQINSRGASRVMSMTRTER